MISNEGHMDINSLITLLALSLYYNLALSHKHSKYLYHWFFVVQPIYYYGRPQTLHTDNAPQVSLSCFCIVDQKQHDGDPLLIQQANQNLYKLF